MTRAAAVLIMKDNKILGFKRSKDGGLGLPCGKVEDDETFEEAAVREVLEETGYVVSLFTDDYFEATDNKGGCLVRTYKAEILDKKDPTHEFEGKPVWVTPNELANDLYGNYNSKLFEYFNVNVGGL